MTRLLVVLTDRRADAVWVLDGDGADGSSSSEREAQIIISRLRRQPGGENHYSS
jgi:hypothetical protein